MLNTTRVRKTNQAWQQKDCRPTDNIVRDPVNQISSLPKKYKKLINYILESENKKYKEVYPNQTTLGNIMGCGRQRANEIIGEVQELGLIITNYRHMDSCLYKTSSFLRTPFIAQKLGHIFPSLRKLLLLLAIPCFKGGIGGEATQLNLKNYNVYKYTESTKKIVIDLGVMHHQVNKYSPLSQSLSRQRLTLEQKCILSAFPEWLIDQAMFKITDMNCIEDLGAYLYDYCRKRCRKPDWIWSSKLKDLYKDEPDYRKMPSFVEEDDMKDAYLPHQPAYKKPTQPKNNDYYVEPRRSPGGISPANPEDLIPAKERLWSRSELETTVDRLSSLGEVGRIGARAIMERQTELLSQLSPDEQAAWAEGALLK